MRTGVVVNWIPELVPSSSGWEWQIRRRWENRASVEPKDSSIYGANRLSKGFALPQWPVTMTRELWLFASDDAEDIR